MAEMLFYEKPVPLSSVHHADWTLRLPEPRFGFAASINSVVLAGIEFVEASKDYPIVFAKAAEALVPVALLGLRETKNLYVDSHGEWLDGHYVPAFIRRYPFVLAEGPGPEPVVCIDEAFEGFGKPEGEGGADGLGIGEALFLEGEPQPVLSKAMEFLGEFQRQFDRTKRFVAGLEEHDLLTEVSATITDQQSVKTHLKGLKVVDEQKLIGLSDEVALRLFRSGELSWIYAHLMSIGNLKALSQRAGLV
ncbi:MAG: SapC family protein [Pseudomonadales bacterium]